MDIMNKFENAEMLGLRDKSTNKLIAVYPQKATGTDAEIEKIVKDWYYMQNCSAENKLKSSYVDILTEEEIKSYKS